MRQLQASRDRAAIDLETLDPSSPDWDDLEPLVEAIGDATVVGLGESAHHLHEFALARHRLLRFLVQRLGFRAFVMESGLLEALPVNAWVQGGPGDLEGLLRKGFTYQMGACEEMREQLLWMRQLSREAAPVELFGMDALDGLRSPRHGLAQLSGYLEDVDPELRTGLLVEIEGIVARFATDNHAESLSRYRQLDAEQRDRLSCLVTDLDTALAERAPEHTRLAPDAARGARWAARLVRQLDVIFRSWAERRYNRDVRDLFMADNLESIHRSLGSGARIVVAAHNAHLARQPLVLEELGGHPRRMLGQHLADRYGEAYRPIAFTCRTGTLPDGTELGEPRPGSLDHVMAQHPTPTFVTDLRHWPAHGPVAQCRSMRLNDTYCELDPVKAFDLVLHIETVSPARTLEAATA